MTIVVRGVGLRIWVSGVGMFSWCDNSMRSCNEWVMSWGVLWWWVRSICCAWGSVLSFCLCEGAMGSR